MDIFEICKKKLIDLGLSEDKRYQKRLKWEIDEIAAKDKFEYFVDLYTRKVRYPYNQNNLLICWLLGIVSDYSIDKEPNCIYGEFGDVDVDYLDMVRDYLKNVWAPNKFGEKFVCNIGNYTTFKLKNALIDMARVHSESRDEILTITKGLDDKDDEGKVLTWDAAMKLYPDLKKYCDEHKEVAEAAKRLLHRNRGMGIHAGGLIISNSPLHDLVPLVKRKDNPQASAWVEGLHGQDLGPVGLVKFDLLVISNLLQIAKCCRNIKERHEVDGIANLPGESDWTDVKKWRDDPEALAMADRGDLKCIFQFDKDTVRSMARQGGVTCFEDLVAYTSLNRPGCLGVQMDKRYIERKRGREEYVIHPLLKPILDKTYGVMVFQEDIMRMLHVVGEIPLKDCELVRKAISKKKVEGFITYKEMFIKNGQKNLQLGEAEINHLWGQIESWAEYGFNKSHAVAYTYISSRLLYLKAHYAHEFYTAILSCEVLSEKIKEYKMESKLHGVDMHRLDINKSKLTFELVGDVIYYGISNIKGIGTEPAKRIVANQPYTSFEDFLHRFGTDASVLKPLIGLRCFHDADPITLWKFVEYFKDNVKKFDDKKKRFAVSLTRYQQQFEDLTGNHEIQLSNLTGDQPFDAAEWRNKCDVDEEVDGEKEVECEEGEEGSESRWVTKSIKIEGTEEDRVERKQLRYFKRIKAGKKYNRWKVIKSLWNRYKKSIDKDTQNHLKIPKLVEFNAEEWNIDDAIITDLRDSEACEKKYYGFQWVHDLEKSPDFKGGLTFEQFRSNADLKVGAVEIKVLKVSRLESKKKKGFFYRQVECEDVANEVVRINIWEDDWGRWEPEFSKGNLLRVRVQPPSGPYPTYTFDSPPRHLRWKMIPKKKEDDFRVVIMQPAKKQLDDIMTHQEVLDKFFIESKEE